jgi:hypothetical protein
MNFLTESLKHTKSISFWLINQRPEIGASVYNNLGVFKYNYNM